MNAEVQCPQAQPQVRGGVVAYLQVEDIDAWWARAIAAGAEAILPVQDMFWGARYGQLRDPFGVRWSFNQPLH